LLLRKRAKRGRFAYTDIDRPIGTIQLPRFLPESTIAVANLCGVDFVYYERTPATASG
jgi:hypothetical protein